MFFFKKWKWFVNFEPSPEITALIRSGYQHYSLVTSEEIEKMRMDERLKVVRGLEENTMKSACRRVTSDLLPPNAVIGSFFIFESLEDFKQKQKDEFFQKKIQVINVFLYRSNKKFQKAYICWYGKRHWVDVIMAMVPTKTIVSSMIKRHLLRNNFGNTLKHF